MQANWIISAFPHGSCYYYIYFLWTFFSCTKCCELPCSKAALWMPYQLKQQRRMIAHISQTALFLCLGMMPAFLKVAWCYWLLCSSQSLPFRCFFLYIIDLLVILYLLSVDDSYKIRRNLYLLLLDWMLFIQTFILFIILIIILFPVRLAAFYSFCVLQIENHPLF